MLPEGSRWFPPKVCCKRVMICLGIAAVITTLMVLLAIRLGWIRKIIVLKAAVLKVVLLELRVHLYRFG